MKTCLANLKQGAWLCSTTTGRKKISSHTYLLKLRLKTFLHHLRLFLTRGGRWGTTDDFTASFLHFSLFSTVLWDLPNSRPAHSLMSSHLFLCLPCLLHPFIVPRKVVLARPHKRETCPYHFSLCLFPMVRRSLCGPVACWILAHTSSLVTRSLYRMRTILQ